jgi:hypothetical protein
VYSTLQRLNAVFCYALVVAGCLVFALAVSSFWLGTEPTTPVLTHAQTIGLWVNIAFFNREFENFTFVRERHGVFKGLAWLREVFFFFLSV